MQQFMLIQPYNSVDRLQQILNKQSMQQFMLIQSSFYKGMAFIDLMDVNQGLNYNYELVQWKLVN
jgi:hypothetical protein